MAKIKLISKEGDAFEVEEEIVSHSITIKGLVDDCEGQDDIKLENISTEHLKKVIEFLTHMKDNDPPKIEKPLQSKDLKECTTEFYANFVDLPL